VRVESPAASRFGPFLKAAGKLAAARQVSALVFAGAVFAVPLWAPRNWVTEFVWAYFAMLTLTSLLGLGFERLATMVVSERGDAGAPPLTSLVVLRLATLPIAAVALWLMLAFVGVSLSVWASAATLIWVIAALLTLLGFGGLRALKNSTVEPVLVLASRLGQAATVCLAAAGGASVAVAIGGVAAVEVAAALVAFRALGKVAGGEHSLAGIGRLPWRQVVALAGIEVVALAYLRADLLLVGRLLGADVGAVYGMLYRVLDAATTAIGSVGLWLFAEHVTSAGEAATESLRERSLVLVPRLAFGVAAAALLVSERVGDLLGLSANATTALQLLIAAFPLLGVNSLELHARSGAGRNREVLRAGTIALLVNVALCLALIPRFGLVGAAAALLVSETTQSIVLFLASPRSERLRVGRPMRIGLLCGLELVALGAAVRADAVAMISGLVLLAGGLLLLPPLGRIRDAVVAR
jgi:O-antigen/teichoic acid export membrane protein